MEEHRHHQGRHQDRRPPAGTQGGRGLGPHHLCHRPCRSRSALRHRLLEAPEGARLGAFAAVRGGHRKNRPLVSGQSGVAQQRHLWRLPEVLRKNVFCEIIKYKIT